MKLTIYDLVNVTELLYFPQTVNTAKTTGQSVNLTDCSSVSFAIFPYKRQKLILIKLLNKPVQITNTIL